MEFIVYCDRHGYLEDHGHVDPKWDIRSVNAVIDKLWRDRENLAPAALLDYASGRMNIVKHDSYDDFKEWIETNNCERAHTISGGRFRCQCGFHED